MEVCIFIPPPNEVGGGYTGFTLLYMAKSHYPWLCITPVLPIAFPLKWLHSKMAFFHTKYFVMSYFIGKAPIYAFPFILGWHLLQWDLTFPIISILGQRWWLQYMQMSCVVFPFIANAYHEHNVVQCSSDITQSFKNNYNIEPVRYAVCALSSQNDLCSIFFHYIHYLVHYIAATVPL